LQSALVRWIERAQVAGFDEEDIAALFATTLRSAPPKRDVA
jgi:hypothetical protein